MKEVHAYLNFDGNCRQAMTFYQGCLGAELQLTPFHDANGQPSTDPGARIMHSQLTVRGAAILMASDTHAGGTLQHGNDFSMSIQCESVEEIERLFAALGEGGEVKMPLADMFWGARFGMLTDRFGIQWMLNCFLKSPQ